MKAFECGQKFICFSFVIEDGKVTTTCLTRIADFRIWENSFSSQDQTKILDNAGPNDDPIDNSYIILYIVLLKLNST